MKLERKGIDDSDTQAMSLIVSQSLKACIQQCATCTQDVVTVCTSAAASPMCTMAQLVGKDHALTRESLLYSCLFLSRAVGLEREPSQVGDEYCGGLLSNNPEIAAAAMDDMRKLIGKEPMDYLHAPFVNSVTEGLKQPRPAKLLPFRGRHDIN